MGVKLVFSSALIMFFMSLQIGSASSLDSSTASNITVRPFLENININPSEKTKQFDLTISNDSKFKQVFHLSTINFGTLNETGGLAFQGASGTKISSKYGLTKWLTLSNNDIELGPSQQSTVIVTINNDKDLAPGAHYTAIITTASNSQSAAGQLTVTPKVSSLIFATKIGGEFYNIHLQSVSHNGSVFKAPSNVTVRLKSTGNTYITPRGVVSLKQGNVVISRGIINAQSSIVLPETTRSFDVPLTQVQAPKSGLLFSKYRIEIDYRYDGISNFATKQYSFTKFNISSVIVLASIILVFLLLLFSKRLRRHSQNLFTHKRT